MASLTLKPVQANNLSQALKGPAVTAPPAKVFHTGTSLVCP
jgi:hypothetical protein